MVVSQFYMNIELSNQVVELGIGYTYAGRKFRLDRATKQTWIVRHIRK
jgi:hypothetical protein